MTPTPKPPNNNPTPTPPAAAPSPADASPRPADASSRPADASSRPTAATPSAARAVVAGRTALAVVGVGFGLWGLRLLLNSLSVDALIRLPIWLGGAVLADDLFLVPLTIGAGWLLTRWSIGPDHHRTVTTIRTTLLYLGITTLVAIPLLLRQGKGINPTVLPRDYLRDWLLLEATIVGIGVLVIVIQRRRRPREAREVRAASGRKV